MTAVPTSYALKYGNRPGNSDSGLTPLLPHTQVLSEEEFLKEQFQRETLCGFSTKELIDLDAITDRALTPSNLENRIVPFLQKSNWTEEIHYPPPLIVDGNTIDHGFKASHQKVWEILDPILVLTSRLLRESYMTPFFTALFHGDRKPVEPDRLPKLTELQKHRNLEVLPVPSEHMYTEEEVNVRNKEMFAQMKKVLRLGFIAGEVNLLDSGTTANDDFVEYARTEVKRSNGKIRRIRIFLECRQYDVLFRDDLTDCERLGIQWFNAQTLVHEMTHAFFYLTPGAQLIRHPELGIYREPSEPYVNDEPMTELGFAMEKAVFGGIPHEMNKYVNTRPFSDRIAPLGYFFDTAWPSTSFLQNNKDYNPVLKDPPISSDIKEFPIPATFFEDAQQEEFWTLVVRKNGPSVLAERSLHVGITNLHRPDDDDEVLTREYWAREGAPRSKLLALGVLASTAAPNRLAFDFGRRLYEIASRAERKQGKQEELLQISTKMKDVVEQIPILFRSGDSMTKEQADSFFLTQIRFLQLSNMAHAKKVARQRAREAQSNEITHERTENSRHILLIFNRATRVVSRQLQTLLENRQRMHLLDSLRQIDKRLQYSWMELYFDPESPTCGTTLDNEEYSTWEMAVDAYHAKDYVALQDPVNSFPNVFGVSPFFQFIMKIIVGSFPSPTRTLAQRLEDVKAACDSLIDLRDHPADVVVSQWWLDTASYWIDRGDEIVVAVREELQQEKAQATPPATTDTQMGAYRTNAHTGPRLIR